MSQRSGARPMVIAMLCLLAAFPGCLCERLREHMDVREAARNDARDACYAVPEQQLFDELARVIEGERFAITERDSQRRHLGTAWKDTTVGASRLTTKGKPSRSRLDAFVVGTGCPRVVMRLVQQHTFGDDPLYSTTLDGCLEADGLLVALHARLEPFARPHPPLARTPPAP